VGGRIAEERAHVRVTSLGDVLLGLLLTAVFSSSDQPQEAPDASGLRESVRVSNEGDEVERRERPNPMNGGQVDGLGSKLLKHRLDLSLVVFDGLVEGFQGR